MNNLMIKVSATP